MLNKLRSFNVKNCKKIVMPLKILYSPFKNDLSLIVTGQIRLIIIKIFNLKILFQKEDSFFTWMPPRSPAVASEFEIQILFSECPGNPEALPLYH